MDKNEISQPNEGEKQKPNQKGVYMEKGVKGNTNGLRMYTKLVELNTKNKTKSLERIDG